MAASSDTRPAARPGRRARSDHAILQATRELLAEVGVPGLTIEGVAARSGVAKTTIYRRWRDKDELALAAVWDDLASGLQAPRDLGDTRADLRAFVDPIVAVLRSPLMSSVIRGLTSEIATNTELSHVYRDQIIEPRLEQLGQVIGRAVARGDLRPDTDVRLIHELLIGPIFYRLLLSGAPLDRNLGPRLVDAVLAGFAPSTAHPTEAGQRAPRRTRRRGPQPKH
jgi:AcrR family transcriptional regulator